jgi:hypothetical protein
MDTSRSPTKYRSSCDGCYFAKLKCTKDKPICPRCKNLSLICHYSPSQRTGRHRASKSQASSSNSTTTTSMTATAPTEPLASQVSEWQPAVSSQASTIPPNKTLAHTFEKGSWQTNNDRPASPMDTTISSWPGSGAMLHDLDSNLLGPWRNYLPSSDKDDDLFKLSDDFVGGSTGMTPPPSDDQSLDVTTGALSCSSNVQTYNYFNSITQALHEMYN